MPGVVACPVTFFAEPSRETHMQVPSPDLAYPGTFHPGTSHLRTGRPRAGRPAHLALPSAIRCTLPAEVR
jgi:hypothetical protein